MAPRATGTSNTLTDTCPFCGLEFNVRGIKTHMRSCEKKSLADNSGFTELANSLHNERNKDRMELQESAFVPAPLGVQHDHYRNMTPAPDANHLPNLPDDLLEQDAPDFLNQPMAINDIDNHTRNDDPPSPALADIPPRRSVILDILNNLPQLDLGSVTESISIQFHPSSGKAPKHIPVEKYAPHDYNKSDPDAHPAINPDSEPWRPFRTHLDFEIAELILTTNMNKRQITTLLSLFEKCSENPDKFTISSATELESTWELARSYKASGFVKREYTAPYQGEEVAYDIYTRPLVDWCVELLKDPLLYPHFRWNAERHTKVNGNIGGERIIGEPWTANAWWNIQDRLPQGALPFCIILYADKTRLSSFGTAKGYPVIARCANLPSNIRNGSGVGGGRLVGWLPIVDEDAGETGKPAFANFKRVVWHKGFWEILISIKTYELTGYHAMCADLVVRWFFFFILILSADYEEQCVMALNRGTMSNFPCPVCLVPAEELFDVTKTYWLRSTDEMRKIYNAAQDLNSTNREIALKDIGLRDVENIFWNLNGADVYSAISWDRLHAYHNGLFSDHLWSEFKSVLKSLGRDDSTEVDQQFDLVPRWPGLNHFATVLKTKFADGSKYEDIAKLIVFSSHNILSHDETPRGYCLLKLIRSYLELDMLASLTLHTDTTIEALSRELLIYGELLDEYTDLHPDKDWNFPKNHSHVHMVRDILEKGVTRNANTKPNEKAHGLLKLWYRFRTNFKNVAPQILKMNEKDLIAMIIRMRIEVIDEEEEQNSNNTSLSDLDMEDVHSQADVALDDRQVFLASPLQPVSLRSFQSEHISDPAFQRLHTKIKNYISLRVPARPPILVNDETEISPYQLAKVYYKSVIDWTTQRDLVRVSPSFHGHARNDCVLIKANDTQYVIGQLLSMFSITVANTQHELAHVLPFDGRIDGRQLLARRRDVDLRFIRVRARRRIDSILVDIHSIERGCLLVSDHGNDPGDFIVIDVTDQDMWWRFKSLRLGVNLRL